MLWRGFWTSHLSANGSSMLSGLFREDELECYESAGILAVVELSNIGRRMGFVVCEYAVVLRSPSNGTFHYSPKSVVGMGWRSMEVLPLVFPHFVLVLATWFPSHPMRLTHAKTTSLWPAGEGASRHYRKKSILGFDVRRTGIN
jgi:hypothetical protein